MSKHSPGPWELGAIVGTNYDQRQIVDGDGFWFATVLHDGNAEKTEANAHLIAAAPELLSALEELVDVFGDGWGEGNDPSKDRWGDEAFRAARAAIRKAEGK